MERVQDFRAKFRVTPEQAQGLELYFLRTTLFWNFLLDHLKEDVPKYMKSEKHGANHTLFEETITEIFREGSCLAEAMRAERAYKSTIVTRWHEWVPTIYELPKQVLGYRVQDMATAFRAAKVNRLKAQQYPSVKPTANPPTRKDQNSTQSVQLPSALFTLSRENLIIRFPDTLAYHEKAQAPLVFPVDRLSSLPDPESVALISINRVPPRRIYLSKYGPVDIWDHEHSLTVR